jgi:hypothetical protein
VVYDCGASGELTVGSNSVAPDVLRAAVVGFVDALVRPNMRPRASLLLLTRPRQRIATLQAIPGWLIDGVANEVSHDLDALAQRLGDLPGLLFDHDGERRTTLARSADSNQWGALFLSSDGRVALLLAELGPPLLCMISSR